MLNDQHVFKTGLGSSLKVDWSNFLYLVKIFENCSKLSTKYCWLIDFQCICQKYVEVQIITGSGCN